MIGYVVLSIVLGYLIGSIPSSVWMGKLLFNVDVRTKGSGNAGATNTYRVFGWKIALVVLLLDVFKAWVAIQVISLLPMDISPEMLTYLKIGVGVVAVLGHIFPLWAGFRGGKGVASLVGVVLALYPQTVLIILVLFIVVFLVSGYVSLASVVCSLAFPFIAWFVYHVTHPALIVLSIIIAVLVPLTHRKNIGRLLKGEENRFNFRKR